MAFEIPLAALANHVRTVEEAVELARLGRTEEGFLRLLEAFERAQEEAEAGPSWKAELALRYRQALLGYAGRHRIEF